WPAGILLWKQMIVQHAGHGAAADGRNAKIRRLFSKETDDFQRVGEDSFRFLQTTGELDGAENAHHPIKAPAAVHAIDVRTEHDAGKVFFPLPLATHIADRIDTDFQSGRFHPLCGPLTGTLIPRREKTPGTAGS